MTMCIIQLDMNSGEILVCNAGHESPLRLKAKKVTSESEHSDKPKRKLKAEVLFARGERLGFDPKSEFETRRFRLGLDDVILLYTDGISEAENHEGKEWGERTLKKVFARDGVRDLEQIKTDLWEGVQAHTEGRELQDDITFVLLQWKRVHAEAASSTPPVQQTGEAESSVSSSEPLWKEGEQEQLVEGQSSEEPSPEEESLSSEQTVAPAEALEVKAEEPEQQSGSEQSEHPSENEQPEQHQGLTEQDSQQVAQEAAGELDLDLEDVKTFGVLQREVGQSQHSHEDPASSEAVCSEGDFDNEEEKEEKTQLADLRAESSRQTDEHEEEIRTQIYDLRELTNTGVDIQPDQSSGSSSESDEEESSEDSEDQTGEDKPKVA